MERNDEVIAYFCERVEGYRDEVDLLLLYGSYLTRDAGPRSDVDLCFVPATERGWQVAETFIYQGVGYDLFGMDWWRVVRIAQLTGSLTPLVADSRIYARTPEAVERLLDLGARLVDGLGHPAVSHARAVDRLNLAAVEPDLAAGSLTMARAREHAAFALVSLSEAVALSQGRAFMRGLKRLHADLASLPWLPAGMLQRFDDVIRAEDRARLEGGLGAILEAVASFLSVRAPWPHGRRIDASARPLLDFGVLAHWCEEVSSTFLKQRTCAESGDWRLAFLTAANLQRWLWVDGGVPLGIELPGSYVADDLWSMLDASADLALAIEVMLERAGSPPRRFESADQLRAAG